VANVVVEVLYSEGHSGGTCGLSALGWGDTR
jgi:hypothetical protein